MLKKNIKNVNITYFTKLKEIDIKDAYNKIVYLEVNSPLSYGLKIWNYYGRIVKITNCYFEILEYCTANFDYWYTDQISKKEKNRITKKWAKKSIVKLLEVSSKEINKEVEHYNN